MMGMAMSQTELGRAAEYLIESRGAAALTVAERTAEYLAEDGFPRLARNWREIAAAIKQRGSLRVGAG
jgi:hypothetical protein